VRFFDTQFTWTEKKARQSISKLKPGDIVLLHDINRDDIDAFIDTLKVFIDVAKDRGFSFVSINKQNTQSIKS
ncbi:MAG: hypothetical protein NTY22_05025, partial [Proteobacteria bacterium]|nr:hypothetical protein [Pseudomonadota bacterium]